MKYWTDRPTPAEFDDALHKGFGRAVLWAEHGHADVQHLLDACLNDFRFDWQCEEVRGDWLWQIVQASANTDVVRQPLLDALDAIETSESAEQSCQLAPHFAEAGDDRFRQHLYRIVFQRPVEDMPWLGDEELIRLDGDDGFLAAFRRHVAELRSREWDWYDNTFIDIATRILGELRVIELLDAESAADEDAQGFYDILLEHQAQESIERDCPTDHSHSEFRAVDVVAAAESPGKVSFRFRIWGRHACDSDLEHIFERMLRAENPQAIERYLQVFALRTWPRFDPRLLELCQHQDEQIRRRAVCAASFNRHPEIRKFAITRMNDPAYQEHAIDMLVKNYRPGDEFAIVQALALPDDNCYLHLVLMSLLKLLEENSEANCGASARLIYEKTPCSMCRHDTVKLLINRDTFPEQWRAECLFDADSKTRELVGGPSFR